MKKWTVIALILFWLAWHLATPIDLITADIGRHIKNGELLFQGVGEVLDKNYYSYTCPNYSVINHHWLFGVVSYLIWHYLGFFGVSVVFLIFEILTFSLFFFLAQRLSDLRIACIFGLLSFPFLVTRAEIRPEECSMFFCGSFLLLFYFYQNQQLKSNYLKIAAAFLQLLWVNTHIFFLMGPLLTAFFWLQLRMNSQREEARTLREVFFIIIGMCLLNPSFFLGALTPFNILKGFSCSLIENQSVFFLSKIAIGKIYFYYFFAVLGLMLLPWIVLVRREGFKKHIFMLGVMLFISIGAFKAIRMLSPWGFFMIPLSAYAWGRWDELWPKTLRETIFSALLIYSIWASGVVNFNWRHDPSLGINPKINNSAEFFKRTGLIGPIFNNYDIGGYLIFHFSPQMRFFVDNRIEAFPKEFFDIKFIPMVSEESVWFKVEKEYDFNVIYFSRNSANAYEHFFIIKRLEDPSWAPIFVDDDVIIFLKHKPQNEDLVRRYQLRLIKFNTSQGLAYRLDR